MALGMMAIGAKPNISIIGGNITEPYSPTTGAGSGTSVTSFTVTSPGTILTDDVVLVMIATRQDRTLTTPSGWSVVSHSQGTGASGLNLYAFWHRGNPSTFTFTINITSTGWAYGCRVFRGVRTTGRPWDVTGTSGGTDTTNETPALSSLAQNCLAVTFSGFADTSAPLPTTFGSAPAGWSTTSEVKNAASQYGMFSSTQQLGTATSVASATWTLDALPQSWASRTIAFVNAGSPWSDTFDGAWAIGTDLVNGDSGSFTISGSKLNQTVSGAAKYVNVTPGGSVPFTTADQYVKVTAERSSGATSTNLILRAPTNNEPYGSEDGLIGVYESSPQKLLLGYVIGSSYTFLADTTSVDAGAVGSAYDLEVRVVGSTISLWFNGVQTLTATDTSGISTSNRHCVIGGYSTTSLRNIEGGNYV